MEPLELTAFCAWCFAVALAGGVVGLVLGNIRLPAVLLVASHPAAGAGANIGISGVAATAAAVVHIRAGRINWRLFAWMAPPSMLGAVAGGYVSGALPDDVLLATIGAVLLYFGIDLLRERERPVRRNGPRGEELDIRAAVLTGLGVGVLGGLVGLILGALRMPALLRYVGEVPARAVGTNLAVGVCVGIAGRDRAHAGRRRLGPARDRLSGVGARRAARRPPDRPAQRATAAARDRRDARRRRRHHGPSSSVVISRASPRTSRQS